MKIRTGFVSNSSSSSFVLIGRLIDLDYMNKKMFKQGTTFYGHGMELVDGDDFFKILNYEMMVACMRFRIDVYESTSIYFPDESEEFDRNNIIDGDDLIILLSDKDYRSCESADDIVQKYHGYNGDV